VVFGFLQRLGVTGGGQRGIAPGGNGVAHRLAAGLMVIHDENGANRVRWHYYSIFMLSQWMAVKKPLQKIAGVGKECQARGIM
jgi:hypothetical protein